MCVFRFRYTFLILRVNFRDIIINVFRSSCEVPVTLSGFGALVVSMLASGTQDRGFKHGRSRRIFRAKKSSARLPS
jgi:hypothetical protein